MYPFESQQHRPEGSSETPAPRKNAIAQLGGSLLRKIRGLFPASISEKPAGGERKAEQASLDPRVKLIHAINALCPVDVSRLDFIDLCHFQVLMLTDYRLPGEPDWDHELNNRAAGWAPLWSDAMKAAIDALKAWEKKRGGTLNYREDRAAEVAALEKQLGPGFIDRYDRVIFNDDYDPTPEDVALVQFLQDRGGGGGPNEFPALQSKLQARGDRDLNA